MKQFNYNNLDPGIRDLVRDLNTRGFITTDSGDGVSKPEFARVLHERHVFIACDPSNMVAKTEELAAIYSDAWVECSWSPGQSPNILILPDGIVLPPGVGVASDD